jgi:hypothetical protein
MMLGTALWGRGGVHVHASLLVAVLSIAVLAEIKLVG